MEFGPRKEKESGKNIVKLNYRERKNLSERRE